MNFSASVRDASLFRIIGSLIRRQGSKFVRQVAKKEPEKGAHDGKGNWYAICKNVHVNIGRHQRNYTECAPNEK